MAVALVITMVVPARAEAATLPSGFAEEVAISGLVQPTVVRFSADGRVFVAEKSGLIKVFDSLTDTTPTVFADLRTEVHNFWDRGLLGMALAPGFPTDPWVYALYTRDALPGGAAPRWGTAGQTADPCPTPPGANTDGCVVTGRLVRLQASGNVAVGAPQVLVEDWCNQYPSHSVGTLQFGPDGALYASAGDGASFTFGDYGQGGGSLAGTPTPRNPCGDPPGAPGDLLSPPSAEGGALRSQDLRTMPIGGGGGSSYLDTVNALQPVAYWRLGEASGATTAAAVVGPSGTYRNAGGGTLPTRGVTGLLVGDGNLAASWNAAGQEVAIPDAAALDRTETVSVVAWIRPTDWSGNRRIFQQGANDDQYMLFKDGATLRFTVATASGHYSASTTTLPATGQTHLVVGTYQRNGFLRLYVDGALVGSAGPLSDAVNSGTTGAAIGNKPGATFGGDQFAGTIDEVSVHAIALSASQVGALWTAGTTGTGSSTSDPVSLDGTVIRIDPATGAALPSNPLAGQTDPMARRVVAYGLRNPFRMAFRPGTSELWVGDVGWGAEEEINRVIGAADATVDNMGWPCYEGSARAGYDAIDLAICENLYAEGTGAVLTPHYDYNHAAQVVPGEGCPTGSSSVSGIAFYQGGSYPSTFANALFFADYSRDCIWVMRAGAGGLPDAGQITTFVAAAANPVNLEIGPGGDVFYVDFDGGTIRRIRFASGNQPPTAVATATPQSGSAPLTVTLDGTGSTDPDPDDTLSYAWDTDNDGAFDDAAGATAEWTFTTAGVHPVRLRVTDEAGASGTDTVNVSVDDDPPVVTIATPAAGTTWRVGDVIPFFGSATDPEDGALAASRLTWSLIMHHCPSNCHEHVVQQFIGVASGSFTAPDHEYPSFLELRLTATDSAGQSVSVSRQLDPQTATLTFATQPAGLSLTVNGTPQTAPFTRTVIIGSLNSLAAPGSQVGPDGRTYDFVSWSDGGAAAHNVTAGASATTYTATYAPRASANLSISMTGSVAGSQATYQITARNLGPDTATSVAVTDVLVQRLTFVSATSGCTYTASTRTVRCTVASLASGGQAGFQIVASIGKGGKTVDNTASITSSVADPVSTNNSVTVRLTVR